jgi:hypothetical protein
VLEPVQGDDAGAPSDRKTLLPFMAAGRLAKVMPLTPEVPLYNALSLIDNDPVNPEKLKSALVGEPSNLLFDIVSNPLTEPAPQI